MKCIRLLSVLLASVLFLSMLTGCEEIEKLADEFDIESITSGEKTADTDTPGGTSQSGSESLPGTDTPSGRPWESIDCSLSTLPDPPGDSGGMTGWALMDNPAPDARYDKALRLVQGTSAHIFALGDAGTLLRLDSTPDRWTLLETPSENNLRDMAATGGWYSMIVGDRGTVMRYDLAIGEVKDFEGPFDEWGESDRPDLYAVWGESSENFYIIGDGVFYHYARRKSSDPDYDPTHPEPVWQRLTPPVEPTKYSPYTPRISDVWFWNTNCVVLLIHDPTGRHYTMKWDGSAWREEREIPSSSLIRSIWGLGPDDIFAVGVGASVYHYDGIEWTEYNTAGLDTYNSYSAIWGTGHDNLFVVGDYDPRGRSLYRYNGEYWRSMSTPVSNGLWSVWGWSEALHGVYLSGIDGELLHYVEEATSVGEGFHWLEISPQEPYWSLLEDVATYKGTHYFVGSSHREAMIIKYDGTGTPETKIYHGQILDLKAVTIRDDILYTTGWIDGNENGIGVRTLNLVTGEETYFQDFEPGSHLLSSGIAVDENGSIYVGGQTSGSIGNQPNAGLFEERQGEKNYTPAGYDAFVIKYSPEGTRQWVRVFGNPDSDMYPFTSQNGERVISMDFSPDGTLLVAGKTVTNESLSFIHEPGLEAGFTLKSIADGITEISKGYGFIVRFTSEGVFNGGKGWDADAYQDGFVDMEFTDDGYIYFTGSISYSGKIDNQPGNWTSNILVMKLNASLESIWTRYIDNPAHQWITDTAPSPDGGLFITGSTMGSFGGRQYSDGTDALVTQMSPDGVIVGSQIVGGADSEKGILITVGRNGTPLIWASLGSPTIEGYNAEASGVFWNTGEIPYDPYAECR